MVQRYSPSHQFRIVLPTLLTVQCRFAEGNGNERVHVVVSRVLEDSVDWLRLLRNVPYTLWTEFATGHLPSRPGLNSTRWRIKPRTAAGGTTRECGGYLGFIIENYHR